MMECMILNKYNVIRMVIIVKCLNIFSIIEKNVYFDNCFCCFFFLFLVYNDNFLCFVDLNFFGEIIKVIMYVLSMLYVSVSVFVFMVDGGEGGSIIIFLELYSIIIFFVIIVIVVLVNFIVEGLFLVEKVLVFFCNM